METKTAREIMTAEYEPHNDGAFRRGYHHAVVEALDVIFQPDSGITEHMRRRLAAWEVAVENWRNNNPDTEMPEPPLIPVLAPVLVQD